MWDHDLDVVRSLMKTTLTADAFFQYNSGEAKEASIESPSRSSSVAPNAPSAVHSPEVVHQRVHKIVQDMKEEPDDQIQMHFRFIFTTYIFLTIASAS